MGELHLVHGSDEALVGQTVVDLVRRLVGAGDRSLVVEDMTVDGDEVGVQHVVASAQTPPFLTEKRVVVARGVESFDAPDLAVLHAYLSEPLDSTDLVLVHQGRTTKKLTDMVTGAGGVVAGADVGSSRRDRVAFVEEQVAASGLRMTSAAQAAVVDQLGEDVNRLSGLLETLTATF